MKLLAMMLVTLFGSSLMAQKDTLRAPEFTDTLAAHQMVQWWDSAAKLGFPDTLQACVYGGHDPAGDLILDSLLVLDGGCPKSQLVGLLGFINGDSVSDSDRTGLFDEFSFMLHMSNDLWMIGDVHAVKLEADEQGHYARRPKVWASLKVPRRPTILTPPTPQ